MLPRSTGGGALLHSLYEVTGVMLLEHVYIFYSVVNEHTAVLEYIMYYALQVCIRIKYNLIICAKFAPGAYLCPRRCSRSMICHTITKYSLAKCVMLLEHVYVSAEYLDVYGNAPGA